MIVGLSQVVSATAAPAEGEDLSAGVGVFRNWAPISVVHLGLTALALGCAAAGLDLGSGAAATLFCAAILLLGLPHGALDLVALLRGHSRHRAILAYLALGGGMAALWWTMPGGALLLFFGFATVHFGEDWPGSGLIANGGGLALLAAPLLLRHDEIGELFAVIAGPQAIPPLADMLLLVAPVAIAAGVAGCVLLWISGRTMLAASSAAALVGMVVLPPLAGFALYFGLFHSPRQFASGLAKLDGHAWQMPVAAASGMAILLVFGVARVADTLSISDGIVRATFIVLSVLTVPHMLLPLILRFTGTVGPNAPPGRN